MTKREQIRIAKAKGIVNPYKAWNAAAAAGIPFWVMCAFLMQETNGGYNIYGHDVDENDYPRPFWGQGEVTEENYAEYLKERDLGITSRLRFPNLGRRSQGVGPMQLTYFSIQDMADSNGGCWDIDTNLLTGAKLVAGHYAEAKKRGFASEKARWHFAALKYNGKESYADQMDKRFAEWQAALA